MHTLVLAVVTCLAIHGVADGAEPVASLSEPWRTPYVGEDATGDHVVGLWQFDSEAADVRLQGATLADDGRFGRCLESFPGWPITDAAHRARVENHPGLSPQGAFTLEMWIRAKAELDDEYPDSFLLDKKYVADDDYQLILGRADPSGRRTLQACLGFGRESSRWHSKPARFEPGEWHHVAFTYDGEGTGTFFLDGVPWGSRHVPGRRSISAGRHFLSIGDRIGSYYHGFPGHIDQVRISHGAREFRRAKFEPASNRTVFVRFEPNVAIRYRVSNLQREPLAGAEAVFMLDGVEMLRAEVGALGSGESVEIGVSLDTSLRPGEYRVVARLEVEEFTALDEFPIRIVARRPANEFPVVMWGVYGGLPKEMDRLERIGFTHALGLGADYAKIWEAGEPTSADKPETVAANGRMLDDCLARGLRVAAGLSPGAWARSVEAMGRVDRDGKPVAHRPDVCGLLPGMETFCRNVGASVVQTYGQYPAFDAAMLHTEVRGHARPCFHPCDREAFRKATGLDIPELVAGPRGVDHTRIPDFPESRVIADDHPILRYYRWYWKQGDGWNRLTSALHDGLQSSEREPPWTWHDPAVRTASVLGGGGRADVLSQWTYSYPDPIRIGLATDELLATARGAEHEQRVMKMTQIIWYRSQTAPEAKPGEDAPTHQAAWEREQPGAPFITIAPMHLREALWAKIARPIDGIMYHGWQSLVPCEGTSGYRFTHPETQHELARLIERVVRPLGATLRQVPGVKSDVAFLESFTSEMFARRGTYGWNGSWTGDVYHVLMYAHLQPDVLFEETLLAEGLDDYRVLVMPDCDVLTESVVARIEAFQARGGIVVGDERLCPAIKPDIRLAVRSRTGRADVDKTALLELATELRASLDAKYQRYVDTSNPHVIPHRRRFGTTDYVFLVNDHREYGRYVGHHGIVMENGLPSEAQVTVARPEGFVYDPLTHQRIPTRQVDGNLVFDVSLGPCDGRMLIVTSRPIDHVKVTGPESVERGEQGNILVEIVDAEGKPIDAVLPLHIEIQDAETRPAEYTGYHGAPNGCTPLTLDIAPNDAVGLWRIRAVELATGSVATHLFRVTSPEQWSPPNSTPSQEVANGGSGYPPGMPELRRCRSLLPAYNF